MAAGLSGKRSPGPLAVVPDVPRGLTLGPGRPVISTKERRTGPFCPNGGFRADDRALLIQPDVFHDQHGVDRDVETRNIVGHGVHRLVVSDIDNPREI